MLSETDISPKPEQAHFMSNDSSCLAVNSNLGPISPSFSNLMSPILGRNDSSLKVDMDRTTERSRESQSPSPTPGHSHKQKLKFSHQELENWRNNIKSDKFYFIGQMTKAQRLRFNQRIPQSIKFQKCRIDFG